MSVCEYVHMGVGAHGNQVRVLDPLELELQAMVRHLILGAGHQTWLFWESNEYTQPLSHPSSPFCFILFCFGLDRITSSG